MCVVPLAISDRFTASGQREVVSIQLSIATAASPESIEITPELAPPPPPEPPTPYRADLRSPEMRRPASETEVPEVDPQTKPVQRRTLASRFVPPTASRIPIQQQTGLADKTPVVFTSSPPPQYPTAAVQERLQGTVLLRLSIDVDGHVEKVAVVQSSGHQSLDEAAIEAVQKWVGQPAKRYGRAVASEEVLPIRFRL